MPRPAQCLPTFSQVFNELHSALLIDLKDIANIVVYGAI